MFVDWATVRKKDGTANAKDAVGEQRIGAVEGDLDSWGITTLVVK